MRRLAFPIALIASLILGIAVAAAPPDPFTGAWQSVDNDGSHQTLSFGGSGDTRRVRLFDDGASACGWPEVNVSANLGGTGVIAGPVLSVDLSGRCSPGGQPIGAPVTFEAVGATLEDSLGVTWHRPPGA